MWLTNTVTYLPTAELTPEDTVSLFVVSGSRDEGVEAAERLSTVGERKRIGRESRQLTSNTESHLCRHDHDKSTHLVIHWYERMCAIELVGLAKLLLPDLPMVAIKMA